MTRKSVFNALRGLVSGGLILFLLWLMRDSFGDVLSAIKNSDRLLLFLAFLCFLSAIILLGWRLKFIMHTQRMDITLKEIIFLTFIGHFFNNFLPTSVGGDLVKAYYASKNTGKKMAAFACVVIDRLLGTFTLILMMLISYFFVKEAYHDKIISTFLVGALAASFILFLVLFSKRAAKKIPLISMISKKLNLHQKLTSLYEVINNYKHHPSMMVNAILISILLQIAFFYSVYFMIRALHFYIPLKLVFLVMPIVSTASMAPSINGLGVREGAFVFFFSPGMGKDGAFALGLLWLGMNLCISLIGGILYVLNMHHRQRGGAK